MRKIEVLFFAADPRFAVSGHPAALQLDEDIREIRERVDAAKYRDALEFDYRLAARPEDLRHALGQGQPQVVHFSGHGGNEGIVVVRSGNGDDPLVVPVEALTQLFRIRRGKIRLVVLNACLSLAQAEEIAEVVGCAIGMRCKILDAAAITFGSSFYGAIASGDSVQAAFELARTAVAMQHPGQEDCPALVAAPGVDPATLILVSPSKLKRMIWAGVVSSAIAAAIVVHDPSPPPDCGWSGRSAPAPSQSQPSSATSQVAMGGAQGLHSDLADAEALYASGRYEAALPVLQQVAKAGDARAMGLLGTALLRGQGTRPQPDSAIRLLRAAAKKHDPQAMTALGSAYRFGQGVHQRPDLAKHYYREAADRHWPEAMRALASVYRDQQNYGEALDLYRRAVLAGSADARADAGRMYEEGLGVDPDPKEAACLYRTAAAAGSAEGMYHLGRSYEDAIGVRQDFGKARIWYLAAVNAGSAEAMNAMGRLYQDGSGVRRDTAMAIYWYGRARAAGSKMAAGNLQALGAS